MDINYFGKDSFKITAKNGSVVLADGRLTISHKRGGEDFVISEPGEYEVEGISVFGYKADEANVYVVQIEDLRVAYLSDLTKSLSEKLIGELENIDCVIVSTNTMSVKEVTEVIAKLEPYFVLPYGEATAKFIGSYEHGSRVVKRLNMSKLSLTDDLTEVITFES